VCVEGARALAGVSLYVSVPVCKAYRYKTYQCYDISRALRRWQMCLSLSVFVFFKVTVFQCKIKSVRVSWAPGWLVGLV